MRLIATRRLEPGSLLGRDVSDGRPGTIPLLRAGVKLTERHRTALLAAGVNGIYVNDDLGEGINVREVVNPETRQKATEAVGRALQGARDSYTAGRPIPESVLTDLASVAEMIARDVEDCADIAVALDDLSSADGYTFQHSIDVAAIGMLLGQKVFKEHGWIDHTGRRTWQRRDRRLARLGLGLLVHDVGKLIIPAEILNKPGKLDEAEWELMRAHPRAGVEMLRADVISPLVKVVVRSHHERWDGGGYPDGLARDEIHQLARVAAAADVYDAVTSERVYAPARPADVGVQIVLEGAGRAFDPDIVEVFSRVVAPYPPGAEVRLSDGRRGVVASVSPNKLDRPVVRIGWDGGGGAVSPYEVDLASESDDLTLSGVPQPGVRSRETAPPPPPEPLVSPPEPVAVPVRRVKRERAWR